MSAREWLAAQTPVIEGWKAEEDTFARYCAQRDMGIKAESLTRFFTPYWAGDFEARYQGDKLLAQYEAEDKQRLAGARMADDCFATCCGARGYVGECPNCRETMGGVTT